MIPTHLTLYYDHQRHLVCVPYSVANLHTMAALLQIGRHWFHAHPTHPHYDIPKRKARVVWERGVLVSPKMILRIIRGEAITPPSRPPLPSPSKQRYFF